MPRTQCSPPNKLMILITALSLGLLLPASQGQRLKVRGSTALERRAEFDAKDFVFDLEGAKPSDGPGGSIRTLTVAQKPSLVDLGVAYVLVELEPCGVNLPHVHPRATELLFVLEAEGKEDLCTAFVEENGGRAIVNYIGKGEVTVYPKGLLHYQQNLSCKPVKFLAALNSEDPGVLTITTQGFENLPIQAVEASFGLKNEEAKRLIDGLPKNPALGHAECLKKCGMDSPY